MASQMHFVPNVRGIDRALSSSGVKSKLAEIAGNIASRANSNFALGRCDIPAPFTKDGKTLHYGGKEPEIDPYGSHVDMGQWVPIGKVVCRTALGRYDNSINNTILKSR